MKNENQKRMRFAVWRIQHQRALLQSQTKILSSIDRFDRMMGDLRITLRSTFLTCITFEQWLEFQPDFVGPINTRTRFNPVKEAGALSVLASVATSGNLS
jgi:hypothetical protein